MYEFDKKSYKTEFYFFVKSSHFSNLKENIFVSCNRYFEKLKSSNTYIEMPLFSSIFVTLWRGDI